MIAQGPINAAVNEEMFGHGIFNVDGDEWKQQRRVAASEFASAKLRDFSTNVFKEYALRLAFILEDFHGSQPPQSFDLQVLNYFLIKMDELTPSVEPYSSILSYGKFKIHPPTFDYLITIKLDEPQNNL